MPIDKLEDFALIAAGLDVAPNPTAPIVDYYFWQQIEDEGKATAEFPVYPVPFRHLVRKPIHAEVISVGPPTRTRETNEWGTTSDEKRRELLLSKGKNAGVKVGMSFWIDEMEERVTVIGVGSTNSTALLSRFLIDGKEYCSNYEDDPGGEFTCREPKREMKARTRTQYF